MRANCRRTTGTGSAGCQPASVSRIRQEHHPASKPSTGFVAQRFLCTARSCLRRIIHYHTALAVGYFIVSLPVEHSAGFRFMDATPLLEEKRNTRRPALVADCLDPVAVDRTEPRAALASHNHPVNVGQIDRPQIFQKRFDGEKTGNGWRSTQVGDAWKSISAVLNAYSPPDLWPRCCVAQRCLQAVLASTLTVWSKPGRYASRPGA